MKILYGARNARPDLLKAVTYLACYFAKWTSMCDRRLHWLICYIHSTYKLVVRHNCSHICLQMRILLAALIRSAAVPACISQSAGTIAASPLHG